MTIDNQTFITLFKALANEERLEIARLLLKHGELCAQQVEKNFYLEQPTTSHHLNTLKRAGIAKSRKSGRHVFYSIDRDQLFDYIDAFKTLFK